MATGLEIERLHAVDPGAESPVVQGLVAKRGEKAVDPEIGVALHTEGPAVQCVRPNRALVERREELGAPAERVRAARVRGLGRPRDDGAPRREQAQGACERGPAYDGPVGVHGASGAR